MFLSKRTGSTEDRDAAILHILLLQLEGFSVLGTFISLMRTGESEANALWNQVQHTVAHRLPIAVSVVGMLALAHLSVLAYDDAGAKEGRATYIHVIGAVEESVSEVGAKKYWGRFNLEIVIHHHGGNGGRRHLDVWCSLDSDSLLVGRGRRYIVGRGDGVHVDTLLLLLLLLLVHHVVGVVGS